LLLNYELGHIYLGIADRVVRGDGFPSILDLDMAASRRAPVFRIFDCQRDRSLGERVGVDAVEFG
jgi:hypothetical protein